jgi:hypothetical protein
MSRPLQGGAGRSMMHTIVIDSDFLPIMQKMFAQVGRFMVQCTREIRLS